MSALPHHFNPSTESSSRLVAKLQNNSHVLGTTWVSSLVWTVTDLQPLKMAEPMLTKAFPPSLSIRHPAAGFSTLPHGHESKFRLSLRVHGWCEARGPLHFTRPMCARLLWLQGFYCVCLDSGPGTLVSESEMIRREKRGPNSPAPPGFRLLMETNKSKSSYVDAAGQINLEEGVSTSRVLWDKATRSLWPRSPSGFHQVSATLWIMGCHCVSLFIKDAPVFPKEVMKEALKLLIQ